MPKFFKHQCTRRSFPRRPAMELVSAGAGSGGAYMAQSTMHEGWWSEAANVLTLSAHRTGQFPAAPVLSLVAASEDAVPNGRVEMHGSQGVRVTTGQPQMPPASHTGINGVEVVTGDMQNIDIIRGFTTATAQSIILTPESILIDAGSAVSGVGITSDTSISLQVMGSLASITLTPTGIVMKGPIIQIN
jgi:hypothetical protein